MAGIKDLVSGRLSEDKVRALDLSKWDEADHLVQGNDLSVQYLLVVDAINFCFWPDGTLEYEHISGNLKKAVEANPESISAKSLCAMTGERLRGLLAWPVALPQEEERARLLREVGHSLREDFGGEAANMVRAAEHSASRLVTLVTRHFPGFRDSCVYKGRQVFLYKRYVMIDCNAMQLFLLLLLSLSLCLSHSDSTFLFPSSSQRAQILVGDIWGCFKGEGLGYFKDIHRLTMFADYRVPVTLRELGVMTYSEELTSKVLSKEVMEPGSEYEVEIRACTVHAVEMIMEEMKRTFEDASLVPKSIELDWFLWRTGEARRSVSEPHHRVLTIFY